MTEKRFLMDEDGNITDTVEDRCLYVEDRHTECDYFYNLLNNLHEENDELKQVLGNILLEVRRDISNTNQTGEIKVFINPASFDLISNVLKKYGALKEWYGYD